NGKYDDQIIELILGIQNGETDLKLTLEEQPELADVAGYFQKGGGEFWIALEGDEVIGTIALMLRENACAVLKKFFVAAPYRSKKIGLALYSALLDYARTRQVRHIILDTPSVARASHRFYDRAGFRRVTASDLPVVYTFPDRDSILYMLDL
ncbi:MAG: GNAT family N-acetyltransferase, partial [Oscillospiraceae bacterium]|nr:GNAT family N-acetyltransferase [Oscillospiraceae bacterium]